MELELVSISELARRRGVSKATLARRIKNGLLPEHAFVKLEGERHPLIDLEVALKYMDALADSQKTQVEQIKRNQKKKKLVEKKAPKAKSKAEEPKQEGNAKLTGEEKDVKAGEADDKPKEEQSKASKHIEQLRAQKFDGLVLDETSGYYFADDVEIEEFDGKKIITAKDVLLTNAEKYQKHRALTEALKAEQLQMKLDIDRGNLIDGAALKKKIFKIATETRDALQNIPEQFGPDLLACKDLIELQTTLSHAINKALENLGRL